MADIFQALVQDRPYRLGMQLIDVLAILDKFAADRKIDHTIVALAKEDGETCFQVAPESRYLQAIN